MNPKIWRFIGLVVVLYIILQVIDAMVWVSMDGWQFIVFCVVLAGIFEYFLERKH